ncbi:hypothetical protein FQN49_003577 [Arthroderma sp. PD_2]|nr:hypothetical protein FQN49_003577 [Arthroderma sp. PD_2]
MSMILDDLLVARPYRCFDGMRISINLARRPTEDGILETDASDCQPFDVIYQSKPVTMKLLHLLSTALLAAVLPVAIAGPMPAYDTEDVQQSPNKRFVAVPSLVPRPECHGRCGENGGCAHDCTCHRVRGSCVGWKNV